MTERRTLSTAINSTSLDVDAAKVKAFVTQKVPSDASVSSTNVGFSLKRTFVVPITVRLKPETANLLKRVSLERQLRGEEIFTQQEIVQQAVESWLQTHDPILRRG